MRNGRVRYSHIRIIGSNIAPELFISLLGLYFLKMLHTRNPSRHLSVVHHSLPSFIAFPSPLYAPNPAGCHLYKVRYLHIKLKKLTDGFETPIRMRQHFSHKQISAFLFDWRLSTEDSRIKKRRLLTSLIMKRRGGNA